MEAVRWYRTEDEKTKMEIREKTWKRFCEDFSIKQNIQKKHQQKLGLFLETQIFSSNGFKNYLLSCFLIVQSAELDTDDTRDIIIIIFLILWRLMTVWFILKFWDTHVQKSNV